jgi:hypothetical protein
MYKDPKLTAQQLKHFDDVWTDVAGSCIINWGWMEDEYKLNEDEVYEILECAGVYECMTCNWWQYEGESCHDHEHDEITCTQCCEEDDE